MNPCPNPACDSFYDANFVRVERVRINTFGERGSVAESLTTFATVACSLPCAITLMQAQIERDPEPYPVSFP